MIAKQIEDRWGKPVMDHIMDQLLGLPVHVLIEQILMRMPDSEIEAWACRILVDLEGHK